MQKLFQLGTDSGPTTLQCALFSFACAPIAKIGEDGIISIYIELRWAVDSAAWIMSFVTSSGCETIAT